MDEYKLKANCWDAFYRTLISPEVQEKVLWAGKGRCMTMTQVAEMMAQMEKKTRDNIEV